MPDIDQYLEQKVPLWKKPLFYLAIILLLAAAVITLTVLLIVQSKPCHDEKQPVPGTTEQPVVVTTVLPGTTFLTTKVPATHAPAVLCSPNYQYSNRTGFCYRANPVIVTIDDATAACQADGAHLASIHSKEENDVVTNFYYASLVNYQNTVDISLPTASLWIGLVYNTQLKNLTWSDGTLFDYSNWVGTKVPCTDPTCSHAWIENNRIDLDDGKRWYDVVAGKQKVAYICKKAALKSVL